MSPKARHSVGGEVAGVRVEWERPPVGPSGSGRVRVAGGPAIDVEWRIDERGIRILLPAEAHSYSITSAKDDDGAVSYQVVDRRRGGEWTGLSFRRAGAGPQAASTRARSGASRVRAGMPGRIVKVLAKEGDRVEKGAPLLVIEAMKMENEIVSPAAGKVAKIHVAPGSAVEMGAELVTLEA